MNFEEVLNQLTIEEEIGFSVDLLFDLPAAADPDNWLDFAKRAIVAVNYQKSREAGLLAKGLAGLLAAADNDTRRDYEPIFSWLYYAAMDDLPNIEIEKFFKDHDFAFLLQENLYCDLPNKFKEWLGSQPFAERDLLRERIYNAMRANSHILTRTFITDNERPSAANWLKEYDKAVGFDLANALDRAEFENQSAIAAHLNAAEKDLLKRLFDFYEYVKLTSDSFVGFENDVMLSDGGGTYLFTGGKKIVTTPAPDKKLAGTLAKLALTQPARQEVFTSVALPALPDIIKEAQAQLLATNGEIPKAIAELQKSLSSGNSLGATGALLLLAQLRRLDDVLADEPAFRLMVAQDLEKTGQAVQKEGLAAQPNAPQFLARWLKIILQDNLRLKDSEALDFASRLGELMALEGEGYRKMIIIDERGQAKWNI